MNDKIKVGDFVKFSNNSFAIIVKYKGEFSLVFMHNGHIWEHFLDKFPTIEELQNFLILHGGTVKFVKNNDMIFQIRGE